ncbi:sigma 54-interacting transcriptional regulator [candidate division KSB1 bacterium]|nr:sigma 54-interacting transcriptional regulator [candidate division KSB1 bacterium]
MPSIPMKPDFFEIGRRLLAESEVRKLLAIALDQAIEMSGAERGMIILFDSDGQNLFETARIFKNEDIAHPEFEISRTIIEKVKSEKASICLRNALADPMLGKSKSVSRLKILSVICVPLKHETNVFGVLYLDNRTVRGVFEPETCAFFINQFAEFISLAAHQALERKRLHNHVLHLEQILRQNYQFDSIIGHDPKMVEILKLLAQVADADATVLIQGESGTGKELIARALHYNSRRSKKPFVAINCAALPEHLLESELFGHVRGSFTGAIRDKDGWFETANGGTIFLDEVSEMPPHLQVKLLRILQNGEYSRVGSTEIRHCDVRIVAAASRNLQTLVKQEKFREEFYYRLNVIDICLPPLRDRRGDIAILAQHFVNKYGAKYGKENLRLSREVETLLMNYSFPGNVRELENMLHRAIVLAEGQVIEPNHFPVNVANSKMTSTSKKQLPPFREAKQQVVEEFERNFITEHLKISRGNISQAARTAGIDLKNFYAKTKKYGIDPLAFK